MTDVTLTGDTVRQLVTSVVGRLHSESEAKWIVGHAAGIAPGSLFAALDDPVSAVTVGSVQKMTDRRLAGEPLQYILGEWSFRLLEVKVDPRALVPRPETEQVVEVALEELRRLASDGTGPNAKEGVVVADLGTGAGVIALSLALEGVGPTAGIEVWATDVSVAALELAETNLSDLAVAHPVAADRLHLVQGSWFEALPNRLRGRVHLVVSNPPYVSASEWWTLDPEVWRHEPQTALVAGPTGLEALETLVDLARRWLAPGGSLVLELAPHQAATMAAQAESAGYVEIALRTDLTGRNRTLVARWPE